MPDEIDWDFSSAGDAKAELRAAVGYLLKDAAGSDRGDIVREIIAIVNEVARGLPARCWPRSPGRWHAKWLGAERTQRWVSGLHGLGRAQRPPLALLIAPAIARGNQFFLKLQSFVGRHGRLLALRRQILYGRITACFQT
jgi:hypothetical protein